MAIDIMSGLLLFGCNNVKDVATEVSHSDRVDKGVIGGEVV